MDRRPKQDPEERAPFQFVERPRIAPDIYISRPAHGRSPEDWSGASTNPPADPRLATLDPAEPAPFEFVERPRVESEIYISRPHLGRDHDESEG